MEPHAIFQGKRIAIVHDWLPLYGGAERVLEQILNLFPKADLYTAIDAVPAGQRGFLHGKQPHTSLIQRLPWGKRAYRNYFPLIPLAVEQFDLSAYDVIISSSYAFAKGVLTGPDQLHLCYCHSPIRYAWDLQPQYLAQTGLVRSLIARLFLHYIRIWDSRTVHGVNAFFANSRFIARRIHKVYGRDSQVIYPPVNIDAFTPTACKDNYYLTAGRLVPYKRVDLIVSAFSKMPGRRLIVVGDGPEMPKIRARAASNVTILGHQPGARLTELMQNARAFVFAAQEDFGITLVEAQACATPVIAYGRGGAREIISDENTGMLFSEQNEESLIAAVKAFETRSFDAELMRANAMRFSAEHFRNHFAEAAESEYAKFASRL